MGMAWSIRAEVLCFNRTFMELKFASFLFIMTVAVVLIVPLWNWNFVTKSVDMSQYMCFNRTFMELKSLSRNPLVWLSTSFNRTFMELKFRWWRCWLLHFVVLIVPLWNWNYRLLWSSFPLWFVLIVPLWNWNVRETHSYKYDWKF